MSEERGPPNFEDNEPKVEPVDEPSTGEGRHPETLGTAEAEDRAGPASNPERGGARLSADGLELDRMEVRLLAGIQDPEEPLDTQAVRSGVPEEEASVRANVLAILSRHWIWIAGFLLGLAAVSLTLLFALTPGDGPTDPEAGIRVRAVSASLGGEHYVRFNLWGPFDGPKGEEVLMRAMPKIRHDLILSGGRPEVARSIQENDLYFLKKHILEIVGLATGIEVGRIDLKGLSVVRYSDEEELKGERIGGGE